MTLTIRSHREVIVGYVERYLESASESAGQLNPVVRDSLSDLVRLAMRQIATRPGDNSRQSEILKEAINESWTILRDLTSAENIQVLDGYFPLIQQNLKYTAREISDLQSKLREHKATGQTVEREIVEQASSPGFEITSLGLEGGIQGLWASLLDADQSISLSPERIQNMTRLRGDWFPIEVAIGDFSFIIDDDGCVYTSTENFPDSLIDESHEQLRKVMSEAYYLDPRNT